MSSSALTPAHTRTTAMVAVLCLFLSADDGSLLAQAPAADDLKIIIIDGDNFTNNIKRRTARDPAIEVRDRDNRRVPGAAVVFLLPQSGPGGTFVNGIKVLNLVTDQNGRAVATGFRPNTVVGRFKIKVTATAAALTATAFIRQRNVRGGAALSTTTIAVIIVAAVIAVVVITRAVTGGGGGKTTSISLGPPSLP